MKEVLNDLFGGAFTLDNLPSWITKGVREGKPFVSIKMRCCTGGLDNFVFLSHKNTRDNWLQQDVYAGSRKLPIFFSMEDSKDLLKTIIKEGRGVDKKGLEWVIMDHPAHNAAAPITKAPPAEDGISQVVRNVLKDHLGINVDELPVLESYKEEVLPTPEEMNSSVMKFTSKRSKYPNIAIKLRCENENATSLLILGKQDADKWSQRQREDFGLHPRFFNVGQFTNEQGKLVAPANSIAELKKILEGGEGTAINGKVWKLAE
jgi:hypothetical protein